MENAKEDLSQNEIPKIKNTSHANLKAQREEALTTIWDSLESDTESLVQEKAYQRDLLRRIGNDCENVLFERGFEVEEKHDKNFAKACDQEQHCNLGHSDVFDSLVEVRVSTAERNIRHQRSYETSQRIPGGNKKERQLGAYDEYASLRYNPDRRTKPVGAQFLGVVKTSLSLDSFEEYEERLFALEGLTRGNHGYVTVNAHTDPLTIMSGQADAVQPKHASTPFHLHPQPDQVNDVEQPISKPHNCNLSSDDAKSWNSGGQEKVLHSDRTGSSASESIQRSLELQSIHSEPVGKRAGGKFAQVRGVMRERQGSLPSQRKYAQPPANLKQTRPNDDIVERNKATLGKNTAKQGSYLKAFGQRGNKSNDTRQVLVTADETEDTRSPESQEDVLDPELMWLQKTQKLKVTQSHRENQAKRRARNKPRAQLHGARPRHAQDPRPAESSTAEPDDALPLQSPAGPCNPGMVVSGGNRPPLPLVNPTVNLNINLTTPASLSRERDQHEGFITLLPPPQWRVRPSGDDPPVTRPHVPQQLAFPYGAAGCVPLPPPAAFSPPAPVTGPGAGQHLMGHSRLVLQAPEHQSGNRNLVLYSHGDTSIDRHNQARYAVARWNPSSPGGFDQGLLEGMPLFEASTGSGAAPRSQSSGPYPLLPPIGKNNTGNTDRYTDRAGAELKPFHKSSSDGYLAQMEKHKQLKAKGHYTAYTLTDYKSLLQDVKLGGLGPTNRIPEEIAEKIRRQKLYSNVIREQNKKISRIPFLPAKDPVGRDNKDVVPRRKALEYAKSIVKPKVPVLPKDRVPVRREGELYLGGMDASQMATLEHLQKRHEEEKQAVARFKAVHVI